MSQRTRPLTYRITMVWKTLDSSSGNASVGWSHQCSKGTSRYYVSSQGQIKFRFSKNVEPRCLGAHPSNCRNTIAKERCICLPPLQGSVKITTHHSLSHDHHSIRKPKMKFWANHAIRKKEMKFWADHSIRKMKWNFEPVIQPFRPTGNFPPFDSQGVSRGTGRSATPRRNQPWPEKCMRKVSFGINPWRRQNLC